MGVLVVVVVGDKVVFVEVSCFSFASLFDVSFEESLIGLSDDDDDDASSSSFLETFVGTSSAFFLG